LGMIHASPRLRRASRAGNCAGVLSFSKVKRGKLTLNLTFYIAEVDKI